MAPLRIPWPMFLLAGGMLVAGVALTYVLVWTPFIEGYRPLLFSRALLFAIVVSATPFVIAIAAIRAVREELVDQRRRAAGDDASERAARKLDLREKLAPRPAEPVAHDVDGGPFRGAPRPAPIVAHTPAPAAPAVAVVPGDSAPPKLLT